ncbi:MAG: hypothetical protein JAY71_18820 [Candidatus Thiodiazotropha weberae]|nr:hypothetical protein [Candidatus Thiodiazotropha weberae]
MSIYREVELDVDQVLYLIHSVIEDMVNDTLLNNYPIRVLKLILEAPAHDKARLFLGFPDQVTAAVIYGKIYREESNDEFSDALKQVTGLDFFEVVNAVSCRALELKMNLDATEENKEEDWGEGASEAPAVH